MLVGHQSEPALRADGMVLGFLRNSRLYKQLAEIKEIRRSMIQSQHRASLRMKRGAVRSRVITELNFMQVEQVSSPHFPSRMQHAHTHARKQATADVELTNDDS